MKLLVLFQTLLYRLFLFKPDIAPYIITVKVIKAICLWWPIKLGLFFSPFLPTTVLPDERNEPRSPSPPTIFRPWILWQISVLHHARMAHVKKIVYTWCWGRLVASKPPIYYTKCSFWTQNLILGTSGSLEQFENFMKKHLNLCQTLKRNTKWFWIWIKSENKVSSLLGW